LKAHTLVYHSTLGSRVIRQRRRLAGCVPPVPTRKISLGGMLTHLPPRKISPGGVRTPCSDEENLSRWDGVRTPCSDEENLSSMPNLTI